jgi:repressor LexA
MNLLPKRQSEIVKYIRDHLESAGVPPTFREIAGHFRLTISTVQESVAALEKKGILRRVPNRARNLRLVGQTGRSTRSVPIVGAAAAGRPITAIENRQGAIALDATLLPGGEVFALKVTGDSMIGAGILDGDYVFIRPQPTVETGEIALVIVDDEDATIKRVFPHGRQVELRPENQNLEPMVFPADRVHIQGKVIGVFRNLG